MTHASLSPDEQSAQMAIQDSLQQLAAQLGHPMSMAAVEQLYQTACELLEHISPAPITLARVGGAVLVYQLQETEAEELQWFNQQIKQCQDEEEVEELIESIHRVDAL
ncbi:MAG TPA: hypothetical protein V6D09_05075 [Leptolyngbyaceae cyanobacterium]